MDYFIEYFPDDFDVAKIHLDRQIANGRPEEYGPDTFGGYAEDDDNKEGPQNPPPIYLKEIFRLDGIDPGAYLERYSIQLTKGSLFDWQNIIPEVMEILRKFLAPEEKIREVAPPRPPKRKANLKKASNKGPSSTPGWRIPPSPQSVQ